MKRKLPNTTNWLFALLIILSVLFSSKAYSSSINNSVESTSSTGGNKVSSSTSVIIGESKSSASIKTVNGEGEAKVIIDTDDGYSSVKINSYASSSRSGEKSTDTGASSIKISATASSSKKESYVEIDNSNSKVEIVINGQKIDFPKEGKIKLLIASPSEVNEENELREYAKTVALNNSQIRKMRIASSTVSIDFYSKAKLFGFIPTQLTSNIETSIIRESNSAVVMKLPWYHIFYKKETNFSDLEEKIKLEFGKVSSDQGSEDYTKLAKVLETVSNAILSK
ncbi:MAG: hypothetical protein WAX44_01780 [Minisyncoccia bacterium]